MGLKSKIAESAPATAAHTVAMVSIVPRHATALKLQTVTQANAQDSSNFLVHDLCMREKTTAVTVATCPAGNATPAVGVQVLEANAKFFLQIATTATNNSTAAYTLNKLGQEWNVNNECTATTLLPKCTQTFGTFGATASAAADQTNMWVTYNAFSGGWKVAYDSNAMVANTTVNLSNARHTLAITNKVTPWTSNPSLAVTTDLAKTWFRSTSI